MTLFERTKQLATERGLTLRQVEKQAGLGEKSIYSWKKYTPRGSNLQKVADVLGVSVDHLLGNTDEKRPSLNEMDNKQLRNAMAHGTIDISKVDDSERNEILSANGQPISDHDWEIIKAVLAKSPRVED